MTCAVETLSYVAVEAPTAPDDLPGGPFRAAMVALGEAPDEARCGYCATPVAWVLNEDDDDPGLRWIPTWLYGPVGVLCEQCAPVIPEALTGVVGT